MASKFKTILVVHLKRTVPGFNWLQQCMSVNFLLRCRSFYYDFLNQKNFKMRLPTGYFL